ncbi:hypothetical protein EDB85DRAFT_2153528 [Lactarius pseudohatsudake]|nr:hypothetical protein EDB85DRAFT_2153528 [Lactarius pseudohatsudake]
MLAILRSVAEGGSSTGKPCFVLSMHSIARQTPSSCCSPCLPTQASSIPSRHAPSATTTPSSDMMNIRSAFAEMAARRRASRSSSLVEQLSCASSSSRNGSPSSSSHAGEKNLRRALDTAIGSLHALGSLYERREMRWIEEKHRLDEDQEKARGDYDG